MSRGGRSRSPADGPGTPEERAYYDFLGGDWPWTQPVTLGTLRNPSSSGRSHYVCTRDASALVDANERVPPGSSHLFMPVPHVIFQMTAGALRAFITHHNVNEEQFPHSDGRGQTRDRAQSVARAAATVLQPPPVASMLNEIRQNKVDKKKRPR
jgi:hypothetical protein